MRMYRVEGADPQDLIAMLVLTHDERHNLKHRNRFSVRIRKELIKMFSETEIEMLIGEL